VNYFAPLFLSVFIHFGLVLSFSNFFTIDFDKYNIEAKKPITAYIVFAESKKTQKNPLKLIKIFKIRLFWKSRPKRYKSLAALQS